MTSYFCHKCQARCSAIHQVGGEIVCSGCNESFVEEIPEIRSPPGAAITARPVPADNPFSLFPGSPFAPFFNRARSNTMPAQPPPPSHHENNLPRRPEDQMTRFMHQIIAGLVDHHAGGPQGEGRSFTIQFMAPGGGEGIHGNMQDYAWGSEGLDNILTALLNQFTEGQHPARTLTEQEIGRIPMTKVTQKQVDNGTQCTTCMTEFTLDEDVAELGCKHIFHRDCIVPWLKRNNTCPICRTEIDPSKWSNPGNGKASSSKSEPSIADNDDLD